MEENNRPKKYINRRSPKSNGSELSYSEILSKSLGARKYLAIALAAIMLPLILVYAVIHKKIPEQKIITPPTETTSAPAKESATLSPEELSKLSEDATKADETKKSDEGKKESTTARRMAKIVEPTDKDNWFLAIISVQYPLPDKYEPSSLSPAIDGSSINVDSRIAGKYKEMYNAAKADDCILTPYSGHLSYSLQKTTYERKVNFYLNQGLNQEDAEKKANLSVLPAGCSEHNAGLAVDIVRASEDFDKTKEFQWLCDHAHEYGFILRYPKDKIGITGVGYEPWHWRYVGVDAAKKIAEKNECLEEYLGIV